MQISLLFDEIFSQEAENCEFYFRKKLWKNSWNFVHIQDLTSIWRDFSQKAENCEKCYEKNSWNIVYFKTKLLV